MVCKLLLAVSGFAAGAAVAVTLSAKRQLSAERTGDGILAPGRSAEGAADDRTGAAPD